MARDVRGGGRSLRPGPAVLFKVSFLLQRGKNSKVTIFCLLSVLVLQAPNTNFSSSAGKGTSSLPGTVSLLLLYRFQPQNLEPLVQIPFPFAIHIADFNVF